MPWSQPSASDTYWSSLHKRGKGQSKFVFAANSSSVENTEPRPASCRERRAWLLEQAWSHVATVQRQTDQPLFTILRARIDLPELSTDQLHDHLFSRSGNARPSNSTFRNCLYSARKQFAEFILNRVVQSLEIPDRKSVERSLTELGLYHYCLPAFAERYFDSATKKP